MIFSCSSEWKWLSLMTWGSRHLRSFCPWAGSTSTLRSSWLSVSGWLRTKMGTWSPSSGNHFSTGGKHQDIGEWVSLFLFFVKIYKYILNQHCKEVLIASPGLQTSHCRLTSCIAMTTTCSTEYFKSFHILICSTKNTYKHLFIEIEY